LRAGRVRLCPQARAVDQLRQRSQWDDGRDVIEPALHRFSQRLFQAADRGLRHSQPQQRHAQWEAGAEYSGWGRLAATEPRRLLSMGEDSQQSADHHVRRERR
jgi:hypothetical protein